LKASHFGVLFLIKVNLDSTTESTISFVRLSEVEAPLCPMAQFLLLQKQDFFIKDPMAPMAQVS